jgi:hypothetical protein
MVVILILLFTGLYFMMRYYLKNRQSPPSPALPDEQAKIILPLKLQACERIVLFLERIIPSALILRLNRPELTSVQLQSLMVKTIRDEFEYNLSQQIYISSTAWELVKNAKEEAIRLINHGGSKIPEDAPASELARTILELAMEKERLPVDRAIEAVKNEVRKS